MPKLTLFHLEHCPYCKNAKKALKELLEANAAYGAVEIEWIEESLRPEVAEKYDYYYVPSVFLGGRKLYECSPSDDFAAIREHMKRALDTAIQA